MSENANFFADRPVFFGFALDASGSMEPYQDDVIAGHKLMLESIRESDKCIKGVLYIYQSLFSDTVRHLQPFHRIDPDGNDQIVSLSRANYNTEGLTSLYDAVIDIAKILETEIQYAKKKGFGAGARIALITDGEENNSQSSADEVRAAIKRLRDRELIESSVIIGLQNPDFTEDMLEELRKSIGFAQAISLGRTPKEIRRAFLLASKPKPDKSSK